MKLNKQIIDNMERCYSVSCGKIDGEDCILVASEAIDGRLSYYPLGNLNDKKDIWNDVGGTMSIIAVPDKENMFYVGTQFFPGFNAGNAGVTWVYKNGDAWERHRVLDLAFLHRFDLFKIKDKTIFLGCTLCSSKKDKEDWSDPGKVYIGILNKDEKQSFQVQVLAEGFLKNHGYWRGNYRGKDAGYIACDEGVYVFLPDSSLDKCCLLKVLEGNISEMAVYDIDNDGIDEIVTIEPFHGNKLRVYKQAGEQYDIIYEFPKEIEFAHALWAGYFNGESTIILGTRRLEKDLYKITYKDGEFIVYTLDQGCGSSNVGIIAMGNRQAIISANNAVGEVVLYY